MKNKILATLGAASFALALSNTASHAILGFEPGENVGLASGAPLPEGVFAIDDELYGHRDGVSGRTGLNIPEIVWSTPFSFYNTRLEFVAAIPFFHNDGYRVAPGQPSTNVLTDGRASLYNTAYGVILAHDFGNNFSASLDTNIHPPSEKYITHTWADIRAAFSYTGNGFNLSAQFGYTGTFGSKNSGQTSTGIFQAGFVPGRGIVPFISDAVNVDLTATKKFGKFEIGAVGFAHTDIEDGFDNNNATIAALNGQVTKFPANGFTRAGAVAVGGLVGYDFGKFTLQGVVTREVAKRGAPQVFNGTGKETRGLFRIVVPLYVAPPAPAPVVARY